MNRVKMARVAAPRRFQPTLRTRLALWSGGLTAAAGLLLVAVTTAAAISAVTVSADSVQVVTRIDGDSSSLLSGSGAGGVPPSPAIPPDTTVAVTGGDEAMPGEGLGQSGGGARIDLDAVNALIDDSVAEQNAQIRAAVVRSVLWWAVGGLVLVAVLAVIVGWVVANRALTPLHRMTETVRRVAGDNLGERVALDGPDDEIKELADTFDAMLERLDLSFDAQRTFVANASHELRTPLTISRTVLEVALADPDSSADLQRVGTSLLEVTERNERLIEGLLTLAAADRQPHLTPGVSLSDIVLVVARGAATRYSRAVDTHVGDREVVVSGDEILLERLVQNLVDNACRYNVHAGFVAVTLDANADAATLVVENSGPYVPADEAEALFEPFRRLDRQGLREDRSVGYLKGGAGLGLSIVRAVAAAHHGRATAVPRTDGGLIVTVTLPLGSSAHRAAAATGDTMVERDS